MENKDFESMTLGIANSDIIDINMKELKKILSVKVDNSYDYLRRCMESFINACPNKKVSIYSNYKRF